GCDQDDKTAAQQRLALHHGAQQPTIAVRADHIAEPREAEEEAIGPARKPIDLDEHERRGREHDEQTGEDARADEGKADAARIAQEGPVIRQELSWADGVSVALLDRFGEAGPGA